ncbi:MAG: rod-binding protein [Tepidanaerobacteraceae bacterium]|jgi:flagellar protein FlgJ|nr:rod-binding protein [Tepidanaerobacteraceae bacterium]
MDIINAANFNVEPFDESVSCLSGKASASWENKRQLKKACEQFESIFVYYLLQKMRDTVPKEGFLEQGVSYDIIQSMHDEALAEELSKGGGLGLADQIYKQLSKYI